jgi:Na+-translocating ferredoxin:NAD+ oxidoreductase RnfG subunit
MKKIRKICFKLLFFIVAIFCAAVFFVSENLIQTQSIKQNKELVNEILSLVNKCKVIY